MPLIAQFKAAADGKLIDGTSPLEFAKELRDWGADIIGVNCSGPAQILISQPQWSSRISRFAPCQMQARRKLLKIAKCISRRPRTSASSHVDSTKQASKLLVDAAVRTLSISNASPPPLECFHRKHQVASRLSMNLPARTRQRLSTNALNLENALARVFIQR